MTHNDSLQDFISTYTTCSNYNNSKNGCFDESLDLYSCKIKTDQNKTVNNGQNYEVWIKYLSEELNRLGFDTNDENDVHPSDTDRMINYSQCLLRFNQQQSLMNEDLQERLHKVSSDFQQVSITCNRLKDSCEKYKNEIAIINEDKRQSIKKNEELSSSLKIQKEEVRKYKTLLHSEKIQHRHENNKREREFENLKIRLQKLLMNKAKDLKIGMELFSVPRDEKKRQTWKVQNKPKDSEEVYRLVINNHEESQKQLILENSELRDSLHVMQKEFVKLFKEPTKSESDETVNVTCNSINKTQDLETSEIDLKELDISQSEPQSGHFQLPCDMMRETTEKFFMDKCRLLKKYIRRTEKQKSLNCNDSYQNVTSSKSRECHKAIELEKTQLLKQLENCDKIIDQQQSFIQQFINAPCDDVSPDVSLLRDTYIWDQWELLQREKINFEEQKDKFAQEKKTIEESKACGNDKVVSENISRENGNLVSSVEFDRPTIYSASVNFSPCPKRPNNCSTPAVHKVNIGMNPPSTEELYRTLGILKNQNKLTISPSKDMTDEASFEYSVLSAHSFDANDATHNLSRMNEHMENIKKSLFVKNCEDNTD